MTTTLPLNLRDGRCHLFLMPPDVLQGLMRKFWSAERVVAWRRVCQQLCQDLQHAGSISLVKRADAEISKEALARDFRHVLHLEVTLIWLGKGVPMHSWNCIGVLSTALTCLDLSNNCFGAEEAGKLAEVLGECKVLAHLDLSNNVIDAWGLAGVLGECKVLAHLDLSNNVIDVKCKALAHLNLSNNRIGVWEAGRLAGMLGECKVLAHLNLSDNGIGEEGADRLAGVLGEYKVLAHLNLSYIGIGDEGVGRLVGVLGECKALAHLNFTCNRIGVEGVGRLAGVLGECKALAHLDLGFNLIDDEAYRAAAGVHSAVSS